MQAITDALLTVGGVPFVGGMFLNVLLNKNGPYARGRWEAVFFLGFVLCAFAFLLAPNHFAASPR